MKTLSRAAFLTFWLSWYMTSCVSEPEPSRTRPVIEGWINSDGYPVVIFTSSLNPEEKDQKISDRIITWGKVTISDGVDTVILTGGPDKTIFPPYRYYNFELKGKPGKTYYLTAKFEDLYAEAQCYMPEPTPIDSIIIRPIEGIDTLRSGTLYFTSPKDTPAYYYITILDLKHPEGGDGRPLPAMLGTVKTTEGGKRFEVPIYNPKNQLDTTTFIPQLRPGQELAINLCRITEEVYNFWYNYDNSSLFGNSQFIKTDNPGEIGNIKGGYGVWSAQGISTLKIRVD